MNGKRSKKIPINQKIHQMLNTKDKPFFIIDIFSVKYQSSITCECNSTGFLDFLRIFILSISTKNEKAIAKYT